MRINIDILSSTIEKIMPLQKWGFTESARITGWDFAIIYNSPFCRVKFYIHPDRFEDEFYVSYARLHAPDNERSMMWHGEEYYCWYINPQIKAAIKFFDGYSPQEALAKPFPQISEDYVASMEGKNLPWLEKDIGLEALIWETYGERLFELFDLRRPSLWERYMVFLKEYYVLFFKKIDPDPMNYHYC
jgi:hypothetical protein